MKYATRITQHVTRSLVHPRLDIAAGKDAGDIIQDIGCTDFTVTKVLDQAGFHHRNLLLGVLVNHTTDETG